MNHQNPALRAEDDRWEMLVGEKHWKSGTKTHGARDMLRARLWETKHNTEHAN